MGAARLAGRHGSRVSQPSWPRKEEKADIDKLLEENAQPRELVIQLTKLAIKNIVDPAPQASCHRLSTVQRVMDLEGWRMFGGSAERRTCFGCRAGRRVDGGAMPSDGRRLRVGLREETTLVARLREAI
jgi:hypothetical protein